MLIRFKTEHGNSVVVNMVHVEAMVDRGDSTVLHMNSGKTWNVLAPLKWILKLSEDECRNSAQVEDGDEGAADD